MSIINAYDESEEIVKSQDTTKGLERLPEIAIVTFKEELIDLIDKNPDFEKYSTFQAGSSMPIYKTKKNTKNVIIYRTLIGGPVTVATMEELIARGVKKFIFFGCCGTLNKDIKESCFIIPEEAYRDEGTSYHYLPASDFIKVKTADKLAKIFDKEGIKYIKTKTWTTDAMYRETINNMKNRKEKGCLVVEMECASIMAVAEKRGIEAYQFLYSDDTLDGDKWDSRTLFERRETFLEKCLEIALRVAEEI